MVVMYTNRIIIIKGRGGRVCTPKYERKKKVSGSGFLD